MHPTVRDSTAKMGLGDTSMNKQTALDKAIRAFCKKTRITTVGMAFSAGASWYQMLAIGLISVLPEAKTLHAGKDWNLGYLQGRRDAIAILKSELEAPNE